MSAREVWRQANCFVERRSRPFEIAFLNAGASDVNESVWILRIGLGSARERRGSALQISLQQQTDSVVVPAFPIRGLHVR